MVLALGGVGDQRAKNIAAIHIRVGNLGVEAINEAVRVGLRPPVPRHRLGIGSARSQRPVGVGVVDQQHPRQQIARVSHLVAYTAKNVVCVCVCVCVYVCGYVCLPGSSLNDKERTGADTIPQTTARSRTGEIDALEVGQSSQVANRIAVNGSSPKVQLAKAGEADQAARQLIVNTNCRKVVFQAEPVSGTENCCS